ncbi:MAG: hypothetical protein ACOX05_05755 [Bacillota bacterium]|jgi:hypothetical protein
MKVDFSKRQQELLAEAGFNCPANNEFSEKQLLDIEEKASDYLLRCCLDEKQQMTKKAFEYKYIINALP